MDANQAEIVRGLRARHHWVLDLSKVGIGCPDLLVWSRTRCRYFLIEIKDGSKPPSKQALTPDQVRFHQSCPEVFVCNSLEAVLKVIN